MSLNQKRTLGLETLRVRLILALTNYFKATYNNNVMSSTLHLSQRRHNRHIKAADRLN
jgi:hypothetical protein